MSSATQREFALTVVRRLREAGYEALWAGGCVRDQLLGKPPKDYDIATNARPESIRDVFGRRQTIPVGAAFGVITVLAGRGQPSVEVATFRTDGDYRDGRRPESVAFTTAEHDAQRRDFSINGLFFDPVGEQIVDYVGGVDDLEKRVIRAIGNPRHRFTEDKLRLLRAVRFAATLDFAIDPDTLAAIQEMAPQVDAVSGERIGAELRRILEHPNRRRGIELLYETCLLEPLWPELALLAQTGDPRWRAGLDRVSKLDSAVLPLVLAAMSVDVLDDVSLRALARRWRLPNRDLDQARWLLNQLPAIRRAAELPWPKLQRVLANDQAADLVELAAAELPSTDPGLVRCRQTLAAPPASWNPAALVTGDDLIAAGIRAGRHFSQLLDHLRDEQLEERITTPEQALTAARQWLKERRLHP